MGSSERHNSCSCKGHRIIPHQSLHLIRSDDMSCHVEFLGQELNDGVHGLDLVAEDQHEMTLPHLHDWLATVQVSPSLRHGFP